jgi:putative flippase GtrA
MRYLVAGGTATLVDLSVLFVLYQIFHVNHLVAAAISFSCGILTNFTINVLFVFESSGRLKKEFLLFASVGMGGLVWTEIILWSFSNKLGLPVMLAKLFAIVFVLFWNFFMRKFLVFKKNT